MISIRFDRRRLRGFIGQAAGASLRKSPVKIGWGSGSMALRHLSDWQVALSVIAIIYSAAIVAMSIERMPIDDLGVGLVAPIAVAAF
jgi:hypothetical protein